MNHTSTINFESNVQEKPIHILHVFATFNVGGTEVRTCNIINNLGSRFSHSIRILKSGTDSKQLLNEADTWKIINTTFPTNLFKAILSAKKEIHTLKPDLIITYSWGAIEWVIANTLFNHIPLFHAEDGFTDETPANQKILRLFIRRLFFRFSHKLVVPAIVLKKVAKKKWFVPENRIEYIPNSVDTNRFKPSTTREPHKKCILGIIGTLYAVKNHKRLFRVISQIPAELNLEVWIIGSGPDETSLITYGNELSISNRLKFLGLRKDTESLLQKMDIFCLTSDHEQMPLTVLEAMACGLPIMSTDVGDVKTMVSEGNTPFITPINKEERYLSKLLELISSEKLRLSIGTTNRKRCCELFSTATMYNHYRTLFELAFNRATKY